MPLINLIAEQRFDIRRAERRTRIAFFAFASSACIVVAGIGFMLFVHDAVESEVAKLTADVKRLEPTRNAIEANRKALQDLGPRLGTLEDAQAMTARWARILNHLSHQTPSTMWLTSVRATSSDPAKPVAATFMGLSSHLDPVGEFILRLQTCADLESVNFKYAHERVTMQGRAIEFEVTADVAGTAETKPTRKTGDEKSA